MSSSIKLSLLALAGVAAAVPHYGAHSKFHHRPSGSGPYWGGNATRPHPTATGLAEEATTTTYLDETITSTITSTVYLTLSPSPVEAPSSVGVAEAPTGGDACGPATVYVTATSKVTVTVPAGGEASSVYTPPSTPEVPYSSAAPEAPSSFAIASSAVVEEQPSSKAPEYTPVVTPEEVYSSAVETPAPSSAAPESSAPASSAAPSATPSSPAYSGGKRGLAYRWDGAADCKSFADKGFGFAWNWESDSRGDIGGIAFIPTLRTLDNAGDWAEKSEAAISGGSTVVFGFNEPDMPSQANMGVAAACDAWKTYMNPIASAHPDVTIVGPSVSSSETEGQGLSWLTQFQSQCTEAVWGSAAFHWYGPSSAGFDAFKAYIEKASAQIGKPFFVTEFGLTGASPEESAAFLKSAQEYLDAKDGCQGYSYFAVGSFDASANLLGTADSLTATGEVYVS
ncbi:glycoside hydrolase family 128 protein [Trematosphaeria pertusa]|uniref:Glycoside hydrolase family 128 protein n=1 Tax=Trematosphaeria pertusa TaxID=390896 RepID=A0A6A6HRM3_9PLEO|nr:glycoside hydrolase family 128 protein [Trematosphaeria pertusa]KAF2240661.1 glycoside hydrolase family 128 protein [Trematosphaeria pertusa]